MKSLFDIKKDLREILPQGIDLTFQALKSVLPDASDTYKDLILLESRYMDASRQLLQGIISNEAAQIEFNKIRKDLLDFIDSLQESQLKSGEGTSDDGRPDIYNGEVMYRIPKKMTQNEEVKCIVRLAFDRQVLMEDLEEEAGDVLKDLRISDVMGVELLDAGTGAFEIRTLNDMVQFVEKDFYTEWLFFVKPMLPGTHPLVLKITVIEIRNGVERKRNVVLEEEVEILTTQPVGEETAEFASAGYAVQLASGHGAVELPGAAKGVVPRSPSAPPSAPVPQPVSPAIPAKSKAGAFKRMASALAGLLVLLVASWAIWGELGNKTVDDPGLVQVPGSKSEGNWEEARKKNTREAYEDFVADHPDSEYHDDALAMLEQIERETWQAALAANDVAAIYAYLDAYPNGRYVADAIASIEEDRFDNHAVEAIEQEILPTAPVREDRPKQTNKIRRDNTKTNKEKVADIKKEDTPQRELPPDNNKPNEPKPEIKNEDKPLPMRMASRMPVHSGCENRDQKKEEECTQEKIRKHIQRFLEYPTEAKRRRIQGTVTVEFVVERNGRITDVHAKNDIGGGCAEEAVRIVQKLVPFKPGLNREGKPVRIQYILPIRFKLQ